MSTATRPTGYRDSLASLAAAQKSGRGAPAYSRFVNRPLGRRLAALAHQLGATPDQVTAVSALATFTGIGVLVALRPSWPVALLVGVLLVLGYALDAADGQLARLRGGGSMAGEWLDHMVDCAKISTLHLAVAVALFRFTDVPAQWLLVPLGFAVVNAVSFFAQILNEQLLRGAAAPATGGDPPLLLALLKVPTDYGVLCLVFLLWGAPTLFLAGYAVMFVASAGYLALALVTWHGRVVAADEERVR